ncbi:uncharacterized protein LOC127737150 [Mytilus californianus]|uniref:uncharacterized protein LOC127737150 n=1 Tax=Mytilus californianus TaxID=6549 RepID=UPI002246A13E|nr:uncharacterized protein LOC127737150 [Mytilus californianus]
MASKYTNCQFCEESPDAKWHCQSCDLNLCDVCNPKIHTKIEKLSGHTVFLIQDKDIIEDLENLRKVDLKEITCSKHSNHKSVTFCLNCDKSLCSSCLIKPFQYEELNKVYEERCLFLKDLKCQIDKCYPFFEEKATDFRNMDDEVVAKHNEIKRKISCRKKEVKDSISKEALDVLDVMEGIWDTDNNPIVIERERLSQIEQDLKTRKNRLDKALETRDPDAVFSTVENISRDIPEKSALEIIPPDLIYIEPKVSFMKQVIGLVIRMPKVLYPQTFHVDFPDMNGLISLNDYICVMYNTDSRRFKYFTISGSKFITTKEIIDDSINKNSGFFFSASVKILGVTNYNGEIVLSDDTFQIRRLKTNGTFEKLSPSFTTDKLMFYGIHAANNNEILVGFTVSG